MAQKLVPIDVAAKRTGYAIATLYNYHSQGVFPPPRERRGRRMMFDMEDIRFFLEMRKPIWRKRSR